MNKIRRYSILNYCTAIESTCATLIGYAYSTSPLLDVSSLYESLRHAICKFSDWLSEMHLIEV